MSEAKAEALQALNLLMIILASCAFSLLMIGHYSPFMMSTYAAEANNFIYDMEKIIALVFLLLITAEIMAMLWYLWRLRAYRDKISRNLFLINASHLVSLLFLGIG